MIRQPSVAGTFYPSDPLELKNLINGLAKQTNNRATVKGINAIIVPHAGYIYSGGVAMSVYKLLYKRITDRIILLGPSHFVGFNCAGLSTAKFWQTPFGKIEIDQNINNKLVDNRHFKFLDNAHLKEHSLEVQLPFLQTIFYNHTFKLVPLVMGQDVNYEKIGKRLGEIIDDKTLIVVSTDLSHYFNQEQANTIDQNTIDFILKGNSKDIKNEVDACGLEGILILNEIAKTKGWTPELISYKTSGDMTNDLSSVVGYAGFIYK